MAIPKKIIDLTTLALQDRVLTFKERETIVAEALKMGVSQEEIDTYLTDALNTRLQSYTKEELGSCPGCGHGVPLIADQCPYCGTMLQRDGSQVIVPPPHPSSFNVSDEAAQIIQQENINTDQERHKKCPKCGAPYPLVSNICGHCGYVLHEQWDSNFNIKNLIANINQSIDSLKNNFRPTFWMVVKHRLNIVAFYFAIAFFILSITLHDMNYCCMSVFIVPIAALIMKIIHRDKSSKAPDFCFDLESTFQIMFYYLFDVQDSASPVAIADREFYDALHSYEKYQRQVSTIYGSNEEAQKLLADYANEIAGYKKLRDNNRNKLTLFMLAVLLIPVILYFFF